MNLKGRYPQSPSAVLTALVLGILYPQTAAAVLPPDILFSVGASLWQILAMVGVFVTGAVMSVLPFLRGLVTGEGRWRMISLCVGLALLAVIGTVAFLSHGGSIVAPQPTVGTSTPTQLGYRFFSDRFVLYGKHANGTPLLIDLVINRKETTPGVFTHYYMSQIIDGDTTAKDYVTRDASTSLVLPDLFFTQFERSSTLAEPSRETQTFAFVIIGNQYLVKSGPMDSDFVVRNVPEYTELSSAGVGEILVDGERIPVSILHERVYSTDYRPLVFFEGSATLRSETIQLVLWDELGNFYLIDRSEVPAPVPEYTSHFWALHKDVEGYIKKGYTGEARMANDGNTITFYSTVPAFENSEIAVTLRTRFKDDYDKGYVEGQIADRAGIRNIYGQGYFNVYGE